MTAEGHRLVGKTSGLPKEQRIYHGFVKPRELDHDADLYKVYEKAAQEIRDKGGRSIRVRLDFELKESVNCAKEAAGRPLPEDERSRQLQAVAEELGLTVDGTAIHLPDIQIEFENRDGGIEKQNLELLSQNYRETGYARTALHFWESCGTIYLKRWHQPLERLESPRSILRGPRYLGPQ